MGALILVTGSELSSEGRCEADTASAAIPAVADALLQSDIRKSPASALAESESASPLEPEPLGDSKAKPAAALVGDAAMQPAGHNICDQGGCDTVDCPVGKMKMFGTAGICPGTVDNCCETCRDKK